MEIYDVKLAVVEIPERFFERLDNYLGESENNNVFSEDLKASIYLAESDKEIGLVDTMIRRFVRISVLISQFIQFSTIIYISK